LKTAGGGINRIRIKGDFPSQRESGYMNLRQVKEIIYLSSEKAKNPHN
jgi:hypothetical protein